MKSENSSRSRAPLMLMVLVLMVLLFSLCAAVCVRVMVGAWSASEQKQRRDGAVAAAESAAETVKAYSGRLDEAAEALGGEYTGGVTVYYDGGWSPTVGSDAEYKMNITPGKTGIKYLGGARISVTGEDGELYSLDVRWQEVSGGE